MPVTGRLAGPPEPFRDFRLGSTASTLFIGDDLNNFSYKEMILLKTVCTEHAQDWIEAGQPVHTGCPRAAQK